MATLINSLGYLLQVNSWTEESYITAVKFSYFGSIWIVLFSFLVFKMLNADSQTDRIPVMFLTGHADTESVLSVVSLCPVDYLLKTIDKQTLLKKPDDFFKGNKNAG